MPKQADRQAWPWSCRDHRPCSTARFGRITESRAPCLMGGETEAGSKDWACLGHHVH